MDYSNEQKAWTVIWYGISGSPKTVQIEFRKKFGRNAMTPNRSSIHRWWNKFFETNDLNKKKKTKTMWVRTKLKIEEILAKFREDPHASLHSVSMQENMPSPRTIGRILKVIKLRVVPKRVIIVRIKISSLQDATCPKTSSSRL